MSDAQAITPAQPAAATRAEVSERCARTHTPLVAVIESNRFPKYEIDVRLLRFYASAGTYGGERTPQWVLGCRGLAVGDRDVGVGRVGVRRVGVRGLGVGGAVIGGVTVGPVAVAGTAVS